MKRLSYVVLTLMTLAITVDGCKKDDATVTINTPPVRVAPPVALDSALRIYQSANWDSVSLRAGLVNNWEWRFIKCYWNPENANAEDYKGMFITVMLNDSLQVWENNQLKQVSAWKIARTNDGYFKMVTTPLVPQLTGKILPCGDTLLFYDTYVDGCDNYFQKRR